MNLLRFVPDYLVIAGGMVALGAVILVGWRFGWWRKNHLVGSIVTGVGAFLLGGWLRAILRRSRRA